MAITLRRGEGQREAVVEFPAPPQPKYGAPTLKASPIGPELVDKAIASSIEAGWDPLSRGKVVAFVVDESGS
ncbi:MAG: hypothetical protein Q8J89_01365 [Caulobacter sp.]|nr:hypothetical protein [Caulobacter sp.]